MKFCSKIYLILRILTDSFGVFSVHEQTHSAYSQYFTDSFCVIGECSQIFLNILNGIIFVTVFKGILLQKVCLFALGPKTYKE
jgi:hypothetical protein